MLLSFRMKNYKSFYNEVLFEMDTEDTLENDPLNFFKVNNKCLLKSSFVYGKNAGGKSNFFQAIKRMQEIVLESFKNEKKLDVIPFAFNNYGEKESTEFEVEFYRKYKEEYHRFRYGFSLFEGQIISEWLYRKVNRESYVFKREKGKKVKINSNFEKQLRKYEEFTKSDSLFLSVVNKLDKNEDNICNVIFEFFADIIFIDSNYPGIETIIAFEKDYEIKNEILSFIKEFDQDIEDIYIKSTTLPEGFENNQNFKDSLGKNYLIRGDNELITIISKHKKYNEEDGEAIVDKNFNNFESDGTKKLFSIATPIVYALNFGNTIFFDEFDSKLHPLIVKKIISKFDSIDSNKMNAQFICNTHNPLILDDESLINDQFWFVNKNINAESEMYRLSDFKGLRNKYLSKRYLLGQFEAIPKL